MIYLCAFAYAYSMISLYYTITIIMVWKFTATALTTVMGYTKWLLKEIHFGKYIFKLKIESIPMCVCPYFHNKSKWLKDLRWDPMCLVDWVYLLRILNSHYLLVCFHKYSSITIGFKSTAEFWDVYEPWNVDLSLELGTPARMSRRAAGTWREGYKTKDILCMIVIMFWINLYFKLYLFPTLWIVNPYSITKYEILRAIYYVFYLKVSTATLKHLDMVPWLEHSIHVWRMLHLVSEQLVLHRPRNGLTMLLRYTLRA